MYDWLKTNQKKLLAVIGAFLMVSFLISVPMGALTQGSHTRGLPIAHIGKAPVYADERKQAEVEWRLLDQSYFFNQESGQPERATELLGPAIDSQMKEHPELFMLLVKEAEARGMDVSSDVVNTVVQNEIHPMSVPPTDKTWHNAVHDFLLVRNLRNLLISDTKFSEPKWKQLFAERTRKLRLNLVEFNADQLSHATTQPTTQQVETLFDSYKNVLADSNAKPADDILGFGYEVPNRVKLQYLTVSRDEVLKAAEEAHRDVQHDKPDQLPYELQVKALEYYLQNQSEFVRPAPETKPATQPTTAPAVGATTQATTQTTTQPTTTAVATTTSASATTKPTTLATTESAVAAGPTTRPIDEVQDEIVAKLLKDETDDLEKKIADSIHEKLAADYKTWSGTHPATQPTTGPVTQPDGYSSYPYLEKVAQEIDREFKVLPEVTQVAEWSDAKTLAALPGIGSSKSDEQAFPLSVLNAAPFAADAARKISALQIWQPSEVFADGKNNDYIYRLTDGSPAHSPDLASVQARVQEDARLKLAYEHANELASKFAEKAKHSNFSLAALDEALPVISTGEFNLWQLAFEPMIPNFHASPEGAGALAAKTGELLAQASAQNANPVAIVPMPTDKMVIVAQLANVSLDVPEWAAYGQRLNSVTRSAFQESERLALSYFSYDAVVKRLDYKPENTDKSGGS